MAFRGRTLAVYASNVASAAVAVPAETVAGDRLIVTLNTGALASITPPTGWTEIRMDRSGTSSSDAQLTSYERTADTTDADTNPTYTWTFSAGRAASIVMLDYSDGALEASAGSSGSTVTTSIVAPSVTTLSADALVVAVGAGQNEATFTSPAGYTERVDVVADGGSTPKSQAVADLVQASAGATGTATFTATVAVEWAAHHLAFVGAAAGGGGVTATIAQTAPLATQTAAVDVTATAAAAQQAPQSTQTAATTVTITAAAAQTAPAPTQQASTAVTVEATAAQTAPPATQTAATTVTTTATIGQTAPTATQDAATLVGSPVTLAIAQTAPAATQTASTTVTVTVTGAQDAPVGTQTAATTVGEGVTANITQQAPTATQAAVSTVTVTIAAAQTAPTATQAGVTVITVTITAAQTAPAATQQATTRSGDLGTAPWGHATDTLFPRRDHTTVRLPRHRDTTRNPGHDATLRHRADYATHRARADHTTTRLARHDATLRITNHYATLRPLRWYVTVFDLEGETTMPLTIVEVGALTQGEIPEALLIRVLRPAREGGPNDGTNLPLELYGQTPAFVATVHVQPPTGAAIERAATILDPATLPTAYPEDFATAEEGWVRVDFANGDFDEIDPGTTGTQVQVVLDNTVVRLKTRDVWEFAVADGPAAAVSA